MFLLASPHHRCQLSARLCTCLSETAGSLIQPFIADTTLQVPVFIFELDRDEPVLIDQHYNARALEDLVMVVQNAANQ